MSNFIVPISSLPTVSSISDKKSTLSKGDNAGLPFEDILKDAVQTLAETGDQSSENMYSLAVGANDDLHTQAIEAVKYSTAVSYTSGLVSSAIRAYNELMRMQI